MPIEIGPKRDNGITTEQPPYRHQNQPTSGRPPYQNVPINNRPFLQPTSTSQLKQDRLTINTNRVTRVHHKSSRKAIFHAIHINPVNMKEFV